MLLDTCVVSELARPRPDPGVVAWIEGIPEHRLYLSVLTLGEIVKGKDRLPHGPRRQRLEAWLAELGQHFEDRIIPVDARVAMTWGQLAALAEARGRPLGVVDGLIAATALCHGIAIATRNSADFAELGVDLVDPWQAR